MKKRASKVDPRKNPRQERSRATVTAILDATTRLLREGGLSAANTNRIAQVAGVSVGSLYQYFPNKQSLAAALLEEHVRRTRDAVAARLEAVKNAPLETAVRALIDAVIDIYLQDPTVFAALEAMTSELGMVQLVRRVREEIAVMSTALLEAHSSKLRPKDLKRAAHIAVRAVDCVVVDTLAQHPKDLQDPEYREELYHLVLGYLIRR